MVRKIERIPGECMSWKLRTKNVLRMKNEEESKMLCENGPWKVSSDTEDKVLHN